MRWTDDHCHLGHLDLIDDGGVVAALATAAEHGVTRIVDVGTDVADSTAAADRAAAHPAVWATAGVHPHEARHG
ncbi:MAG: TatD family hydrolase, partial [Acidimicrobiales bacterium]